MLIENFNKIALLNLEKWPYRVSFSLSDNNKFKLSIPHTTIRALFRTTKILFDLC